MLGDAVDMIASGPTVPDRSTCEDALAIVEKYGLHVTEEVLACLKQETPKQLDYASNHVIGSVAQLCIAAAEKCQELGYETHILTDRMCCEAREAGCFLVSLARGGQASAGESRQPFRRCQGQLLIPAAQACSPQVYYALTARYVGTLSPGRDAPGRECFFRWQWLVLERKFLFRRRLCVAGQGLFSRRWLYSTGQ